MKDLSLISLSGPGSIIPRKDVIFQASAGGTVIDGINAGSFGLLLVFLVEIAFAAMKYTLRSGSAVTNC